MNLPQLPITLNKFGYYVSEDKRLSSMLAAINVFKRTKLLPQSSLENMLQSLDILQKADTTLYRLNKVYIPQAIEWITHKKFYGKLIAPKASEALRKYHIDAERYGFDQDSISIDQLPAIFVHEEEEKSFPYGHAFGGIMINKKHLTVQLIEDGRPRKIKGMENLPVKGCAIQLCKS